MDQNIPEIKLEILEVKKLEKKLKLKIKSIIFLKNKHYNPRKINTIERNIFCKINFEILVQKLYQKFHLLNRRNFLNHKIK